MKHGTRSYGISGILVTLIIVSVSAFGFNASADQTTPQAPQSIKGGPPVILLWDPTPSSFRVPPPRGFSTLGVQSASIVVTPVPQGQKVFGYTCLTWDNEASTAFNYAASVWGSLINSAVPIEVNACWANMGDPQVLGASLAESLYRDPGDNTFYAVALYNAIKGSDQNGGDPEIIAIFNSIFDWYYGTDGQTPSNKVDFASVVLHEIGHGLGFAGSMYWYPWGGFLPDCGGIPGQGCHWVGSYAFHSIYDRFTEDGTGRALLGLENPSRDLGDQLIGGNLYFDGPNANAGNGGARVKLYAPSTWQQGSSYSHLDEIFNGTPNALMTYSLPDGESNHAPGPVTLGMLKDLGWGLAAPNDPPELSLTKQIQGGPDFNPGDTVTFVLSIANTGGETATDVVVTDLLSSDILTPTWSFSTSLAGTTPRAGAPYVWDLPDLAPGSSGTLTVSGTIDPALESDWAIVNTAAIAAAEAEDDESNNRSTVILGGIRIYLPVALADD